MAPFFTFLSDQGSTLGRYQARLACSPTVGSETLPDDILQCFFPERVSKTIGTSFSEMQIRSYFIDGPDGLLELCHSGAAGLPHWYQFVGH